MLLRSFLLLFALALGHGTCALAQGELGAEVLELENAGSDAEAYGILYELVETMLSGRNAQDPATTVNLARRLTGVADRMGDATLSGQAYYQLAMAHLRAEQAAAADRALTRATEHAMAAGDADLILRTVNQHNQLQSRRGNYRDASRMNQRALDYFVGTGDETSLSRLRAELAAEKAKLIRQQEEVRAATKELSVELEQLTADKDRLASENADRARELERQMDELDRTRAQKAEVEERARTAREAVRQLSREALEQTALATSAREELTREELERQKAEMLAEQQSTRFYLSLGLGVVLAVVILAIYSRNRVKTRAGKALERANRDLQAARDRSDALLENILPAAIARELKETGRAKARSFPRATILFCDFVNFTRLAEELGAEALVSELDTCFKAFDAIVGEAEGVEKIKTIGDAYMAAAGLCADPSPPDAIVHAALRMQAFLDEFGSVARAAGRPVFAGRIGIHTGPVVAGVVGARKFAYDVWGDTVNTAARMESRSEAGKVNISSATHALLGERFRFTPRGKLEAKNKGRVDMYFVEAAAHPRDYGPQAGATSMGKEPAGLVSG